MYMAIADECESQNGSLDKLATMRIHVQSILWMIYDWQVANIFEANVPAPDIGCQLYNYANART